jgi:hypothetical protein
MERPLDAIRWRRSADDAFADVTDAIESGVLSATPHPDADVDRPKGYAVELTLTPDGTAFATALQEALLDLDPPEVVLRLDGADEPLPSLPVGVSKVPHLGEQNEAELSVKPDGHDVLHPHF